MTDQSDLLHAPLGQPGSGRVRYGAAMALWRAGALSEAQLEVYRIASAHDARDPSALLAERGLPAVAGPSPANSSAKRRLYDAARNHVVALAHPGAAEVRAGLPADPGPEHPCAPRAHAIVDRWLEPALHLVSARHPGLARAIADAAGQLAWQAYDAYPRDRIGEGFATGHAIASLFGPKAGFRGDDVELGLFLIAPGRLYRDHAHPAPELYAPLTGPHGWRFGPGRPLIFKQAPQPVWNPPLQPHLIKVGPVPFLAFFVWTRDVTLPAHVISAPDWDLLEDPVAKPVPP